MSIKSFVQNKYLIMFNNIKMLITLDTEEINKIDLSIYNEYITFHPNKQYFNLKAGSEHYKLLAYLSSIIKCEQVVDRHWLFRTMKISKWSHMIFLIVFLKMS